MAKTPTPVRFSSGVFTGNRSSAVKVELVLKSFTIPVKFDDGGTENITLQVLPTKAIVDSVHLNVRTAEASGATKTLDVGTDSTSSGDADGYMNGVDVSTAGLKKATLLDGSVTLGALLFVEAGVGADVANAPESDVASGGKAISWTPGSADFAEFEGDILVKYWDVRSIA